MHYASQLPRLYPFFLIVFFISHRKYRVRLRELLTKYQVKLQTKRELLYGYGRALNAITIIALLVFGLIIYYNPSLLDITYVPYLFLVMFAAFLVSSIIFVASIVRLGGKLGLLLIMIVVMIAVWRIVAWRLSF